MSNAAVVEFLRKHFEGGASLDELRLAIDLLGRLDGVDLGALRQELTGWESWVGRGIVPLSTQAGLDELRAFFFERGDASLDDDSLLWWDRWSGLCDIFHRWEDAGSLPVGLDYAEQHLSRWPDRARTHCPWAAEEGWEDDLPPTWPLVRDVDMSSGGLAPEQFRALITSPQMARITSLRFPGWELDPATLMLAFERLPGLTTLDISHLWGARGRLDLAALPRPAGLRNLRLCNDSFKAADIEALGAAGWFSGLRSLNLDGNNIGSRGLALLGGFLGGETLERLSLEYCNIGTKGIQALSRSPGVRELTYLSLNGNTADEAALLAIAAPTTSLKRLKSLKLSRVASAAASGGSGDRGAQALAGSPIAGLEVLDLSGHKVGDAGLEALAGSPSMARLTELDLSHNRVSGAGLAALAESEHIMRLNVLILQENPMGGPGFRALLASPNLERVARVDLFSSTLVMEDVEVLASSPLIGKVENLFSYSSLPGGLRALLTSQHIPREDRVNLLGGCSVPQLRAAGRQFNLPRVSKLKRADLIELLNAQI